MVWDPPRQPVNVTRMIIYSFIPILSIYAAWRIQKFWVLLGLNFVIGFAFGIVAGGFAAVFEEQPGIATSTLIIILAIEIFVSVLIIRHYARKYNEKIAASMSPP